jgi:hypothetical protein
MTSAGANVIGVESRSIHLLQCKHVSLSDINDVDIVAQAGTVWCRVIGPIYLENWAAARRGLQKKRDDMCFRLVALTPVRSASASVEVAERYYAPAIGHGVPLQNSLENDLTLPV